VKNATDALRKQAQEIIQQLPLEKLKMALDYLSYLYDKESWEATQELACDPEIVESLKRAEEDVKAGRVKPWREIRRDV